MTTSSDRVLSIVDAARVIYRTRSPSDKQVHRVYEQMKIGTLKVRDYGGPPLKWTTTEEALAEFLAANQVERAKAQQAIQDAIRRSREGADEKPIARTTDDANEMEKLRDVYRHIWRDYFLAVMLRRRVQHRSKTFHRAVVGGQMLLLVVLVGTFIGGVRLTFRPTPPEHKAVERWLADNTDEYKVTRWHPIEPAVNGEGAVVRVEYRYFKDSRRAIYTDRIFRVIADDVTELTE